MGTCLAVIKVIGISTLGLYTGAITTNVLSGYNILKFVLEKTATSKNLNQINQFIKSKLTMNSIILNILGTISSFTFQLAYFGAPPRSKHPYLIYSSFIFPLSLMVYYKIARPNVIEFYKLDGLDSCGSGGGNNNNNKKKRNISAEKSRLKKQLKVEKKKELLKSDLDNSVYKDLGESSSMDERNEEDYDYGYEHENEKGDDDWKGDECDKEIEIEVEFHMNQQVGLKALNQLHFGDKIIGGLSIIGFLIASIGLYGDC